MMEGKGREGSLFQRWLAGWLGGVGSIGARAEGGKLDKGRDRASVTAEDGIKLTAPQFTNFS